MKYYDDLPCEIVLDKIPQKVVSLVPSITETIAAIGKTEALTGVTRFCVHPSDIRDKSTLVGRTKTINTEDPVIKSRFDFG